MWGIEVKYNESPKISKSIQSAMSELVLEHVFIVHPGNNLYPLDEKITAVGLGRLNEGLSRIAN